MIRISASEFSTYRWNFQQDIVRYALHGYEAIGVWRKKVEEFGVSDAVDLIHEMHMDVSSVHWAGGFTGGDGTSFVEAVDDALDAIELAGKMGAGCVVVHPGSTNGHIHRHAERLIESALATLVPFAQDHDVRLAIEPMQTDDARNWTFVSEINRALEIIRRYDASDVGLVLDLFHVGRNVLAPQSLETFKDRIALVQLADRRQSEFGSTARCSLGSGTLPLASWIANLQQIGYSGHFEIELHGSEVEETPYVERLIQSRAFVEQIAKSIPTKKVRSHIIR